MHTSDQNFSTRHWRMSGKKIELCPTKAASQRTQLSLVNLETRKHLVSIDLSYSLKSQISYAHEILTQCAQLNFKYFPKNFFSDMSSTHVQLNHSQGRTHKMRTRFCMSSSTCGVDFKLCQICWDDIRFELMTSYW